MKFTAKILAAFAIMIFFASTVEAADLDFVEQKHVAPPRLHRHFLPPMKTPQKDYVPRRPFRPTPHFSPHVPKPSNDNRGGKRKNFSPPRSPHR